MKLFKPIAAFIFAIQLTLSVNADTRTDFDMFDIDLDKVEISELYDLLDAVQELGEVTSQMGGYPSSFETDYVILLFEQRLANVRLLFESRVADYKHRLETGMYRKYGSKILTIDIFEMGLPLSIPSSIPFDHPLRKRLERQLSQLRDDIETFKLEKIVVRDEDDVYPPVSEEPEHIILPDFEYDDSCPT